jgi:O-antigen/teichoic acid export membrane protein
VLFIFGSALFKFVLGSQWEHAGRLAEIYAPYVAVHLVLATLAPTTMIANRLGAAFVVSIVQNLIFLIGFWLGSVLYADAGKALALATYASIPFMTGIIVWYFWLSKSPVASSPTKSAVTRTV